VVVGGAAATPGGVALAGTASLRVGAGHVQLAVAESVASALAAAFPEAGVRSLPETPQGSVDGARAADLLLDTVAAADAVLLGPGLDDVERTAELLQGLLPAIDRDAGLVLDAYALGALAQHDDIAALLGRRDRPAVLTPNAQELRILVGGDDGDPSQDDVLEAAGRYRACVTSSSVIADHEGQVWRVPQGHPGLATAGSGDVLAGLVVGLLARGAQVTQAAAWATYLHATAGERLSSAIGGVGFLARELIDQVPPVLAELG
jgi:hydroxyethylthiazole kinase-like uncharacterized protein yjeF